MRDDLNIGKSCAVSRGWPSGRNTTGVESEKAVATPAKAFSAPGPYCIAKTPGGRPLATRAKPSAMWTPTRSWRQITGRMPTAAAASMIGVVGKQNRVSTPSRFNISAMTCITCIAHSSQLVEFTLTELIGALRRAGASPGTRKRCGLAFGRAASADHPAGVGAAEIAFRPMADRDARPDIAGVFQEAGAAVGAGRPGGGGGRRRRRSGAGATDKNRAPRNRKK